MKPNKKIRKLAKKQERFSKLIRIFVESFQAQLHNRYLDGRPKSKKGKVIVRCDVNKDGYVFYI